MTESTIETIDVTTEEFSTLQPQPTWTDKTVVNEGLGKVIYALTSSPTTDDSAPAPVKITGILKNNIKFIIGAAVALLPEDVSGGKGKGKGKGHKGKKMGGQDPNVTPATYNTGSLLTNASPEVQAEAIVPAWYGPASFSAGMPMHQTLDAVFPREYQVAMSGGSKNRKPRSKLQLPKKK